MTKTNYEELIKVIPNFIHFGNKENYFYEEELLITVIFSDLARYFYKMVNEENSEEIEKVNMYMDKLIDTKDDEIQNYIITGFLETFQPNDENYEKVVQSLSERMRIAIKHLDDVLGLRKPAPQDWFTI